MFTFMDSFRELTFASLLLRLFISAIFGGVLGLNGTRKRRAAGFRTYMLVCMGSCLTMIISQYCLKLPEMPCFDLPPDFKLSLDFSRLGAQVINGIGFLGAGSVIVMGKLEVKGLTTAACLWTSACMGLAVGAGFYECVITGFILVILCVFLFSRLETEMVERSKNINIYVEFKDASALSRLINGVKRRNIEIYDIDLERDQRKSLRGLSAVIQLHMRDPMPHSQLIAKLADYSDIYSIREI